MIKTGVQQSASEMYPQPVEFRPRTTWNPPYNSGSSLRNLPHITIVAPIIWGGS